MQQNKKEIPYLNAMIQKLRWEASLMNTMLALYRYIMALSTESLRKDASDYFSIMVLKYSQS